MAVVAGSNPVRGTMRRVLCVVVLVLSLAACSDPPYGYNAEQDHRITELEHRVEELEKSSR
jgi:hypothetical protein